MLKVHPSNFRVEGFTASVSIAELATLPVPVVADLGSGLLAPHPRLPDEPDAATALRAGADLVTASGDKLLGGPQCGLMLGDADLVERLRRYPLARALRVDKLTLAALEATLTGPPTPVAAALASSPDELLRRAERIAEALAEHGATAAAVDGCCRRWWCTGRPAGQCGGRRTAEFALPLRSLDPAVVGHVERGRLMLDLIAVPADLDDAVVEAVRQVAKDG